MMPPPPKPPHHKRPREEIYQTCSIPPAELTSNAIYCRLNRVFKAKKNGTVGLDEQWVASWQDVKGGGRDHLFSMFEKVGYSVDRGLGQQFGFL